MIPLFPELRPYLEAVFDAAEPGTTYVICQHRLASANLRTQILEDHGPGRGEGVAPAFSKHAGKPGNGTNAEASPARRYGWIGNSAPIAARHYLQVTDADFDGGRGARRRFRRTRNAESDAATNGRFWHILARNAQALGNQGLVLDVANICDSEQMYIVPPRGVEPLFSG